METKRRKRTLCCSIQHCLKNASRGGTTASEPVRPAANPRCRAKSTSARRVADVPVYRKNHPKDPFSFPPGFQWPSPAAHPRGDARSGVRALRGKVRARPSIWAVRPPTKTRYRAMGTSAGRVADPRVYRKGFGPPCHGRARVTYCPPRRQTHSGPESTG